MKRLLALVACLSIFLTTPLYAQAVLQSGTITPGHAAKWISSGRIGDGGTLPNLSNLVQQSGGVTPGHATVWTTTGIIQDAGNASASSLTSLGVTSNGVQAICVNSALPTAPGFNALCLATGTNANSVISVQNSGTAVAEPLSFSINGTLLTLPLTAGLSGQCLISSGNPNPMTWGTCGSGGGGVSNVATGSGLTGGPITTTGTISCITATSSAIGCVQPDGVTITVSGGVITAVGGTITGPGTTVSGYVPQWVNTTGTLLGAGLPVATTTTASALVETGSGGVIDNSFLPPFSGAITISLGVTSYNQVVPSTKGGAGAISGALTANGSGVVTQAAASNLSNGTTGSGAVVLAAAPTLTGVPLAPTATLGTNTTQLATTAFVQAAVGAGGNSTPLDQVFYSASGDFTPGSTTTLTLCTESAPPAGCTQPTVTAMLELYFDGVRQSGNTWSYATSVVTFLAAIPLNVQTVEAHWFAPAIGAGVNSLGGMTGAIACGTGLSCVTNTISVTSGSLPTLTNGNIWIGNASNVAIANVLSGDATMSNTGVVALATVNSNVGTFGAASTVPSLTINAKGLVTAASGIAVIAPAGTLSGPILNSTVVNSSLTTVGTLTGGATGTGFTVNFAISTVSGSLTVAHGGTGGTTYTANKPLIGNGTSPITSGTSSGTTTEFATVNSALVSGNCLQSDSGGNVVDAGTTCGGGGGGGGVTQNVICLNTVGDSLLIQTALNTGNPVHISKICDIITDLTVTTPGQFIFGDGRSTTLLNVPVSATLSTGVFVFNITGGGNTTGNPFQNPGPIIQDLSINFKQANTSNRASLVNYPPAIYAQNQRYWKMFRVRITEAMIGVDARNSSGGVIDDLEMSAFSVGIWIDLEYDIVKINKLHLSFFGPDMTGTCGIAANTGLCAIMQAQANLASTSTACTPQTTSGSGPAIGILADSEADGIFVSDSLLFFGMNLCAVNTAGGTSFWEISNTGFDTYVGIYMDEATSINISSSYFSPFAFNSSEAIVVNAGKLTCSSCWFYSGAPSGGASPIINLQGSGAGVINIANSNLSVSPNSAMVDTVGASGGSVILTGNYFSAGSSDIEGQAVVRVRSGVRGTITGNRITDNANSNTFIQLDADDWHNVTGNTAPGWLESSAAPTYAIIALNNPAFSHSEFGAVVSTALSTSGAFTAASVTTTSGGVTVPNGQKIGDSQTWIYSVGAYGELYLNGASIYYNGVNEMSAAIGAQAIWGGTASIFLLGSGIVPHAGQTTWTSP